LDTPHNIPRGPRTTDPSPSLAKAPTPQAGFEVAICPSGPYGRAASPKGMRTDRAGVDSAHFRELADVNNRSIADSTGVWTLKSTLRFRIRLMRALAYRTHPRHLTSGWECS